MRSIALLVLTILSSPSLVLLGILLIFTPVCVGAYRRAGRAGVKRATAIALELLVAVPTLLTLAVNVGTLPGQPSGPHYAVIATFLFVEAGMPVILSAMTINAFGARIAGNIRLSLLAAAVAGVVWFAAVLMELLVFLR